VKELAIDLYSSVNGEGDGDWEMSGAKKGKRKRSGSEGAEATA